MSTEKHTNNTLAERALSVARSQIGVEEIPRGSNGGPQVAAYLKCIGLSVGYPWCMAFVYWCVNRAAADLGMPNPLVKTGGVLRQWNETTLRKLPARSGGVKPGDIFIMDFGRGAGHTGFLVSVQNGIASTLEGNTNDEGGRDGYMVCLRQRPIHTFKGVIQLP